MEVDGVVSAVFEVNSGVIQGSCLGPLLFNIFVAPVLELFEMEMYADDSYSINHSKNFQTAKIRTEQSLSRIIKWLTESGLVVNKSKTEITVFHRKEIRKTNFIIDNEEIISKESMNVLGVTFDSRLTWEHQVNKTINKSKNTLFAIAMIKKYFTHDELKLMLTTLFYSRFYYASEIWHTPFLKEVLKDKMLSASSQALRKVFFTTINTRTAPFTNIISNIQVHKTLKRGMPHNFMRYKHAILLFNTLNEHTPEQDWIDLNFNIAINERHQLFNCLKSNKHKVGLNSLANRYSDINNLIPLSWLNLSKLTYKLKCKELFLEALLTDTSTCALAQFARA